MSTVSAPRRPQRVKAKFFVPFAIALLFILLVFAVAIYSVERRVRDQDLAERSAAVAKLFAQKLDKDTNLMLAAMRALMTNQAMEGALRAGDRQQLAAQAGDLFQRLRREHRITHFYLTSPALINILRLHSPDKHGDHIARVTLDRAQARQLAVHGLELGSMGTLTLRLVMPWQGAGGLAGYVEIGEEIEHLIDEISQSLAVDLVVLVDKHYLQEAQWQRGQTLMQRQGDWARFTSHAALAQTTAALPAALDERRLAGLLAGGTTEIRDGERALHLALVPLDDIAGRRIGHLVVMRDISALASTVRWSLLAVLGVSLLAAAGVLGVFYLALERVERDYRRQHDLEHQLLHLDTEHRRILQIEKLSALGTMVGGIAHQLNNPLVGVVNLAQLAEREADVPVRVRELLGEIRSAGADCRAFVKRMLVFSKVSSFEGKPTEMAALIEETVLLFRQAESRHLPVTIDLEEVAAVITVDPVLIRHALFNLLLNAAQATDGDGEIRITLRREDDPERGLPGWTLAVTDHGRGMAPAVLEKVFVPFFTTRSDGTGLGLPVVQHVVLLHNGQITAHSEPGRGTRIAIWLPGTLPATPSTERENA
ncbi:MAG: histidine kinase [Betaproteobacteria bacterium HGW-Betaproteobacteria-12]|nr:MAG: histidine kinase [Betaproteobacteria bacterium HGW-Betaproteobacteria-12]